MCVRVCVRERVNVCGEKVYKTVCVCVRNRLKSKGKSNKRRVYMSKYKDKEQRENKKGGLK